MEDIDDLRPEPDVFLSIAQYEEEKKNQGKLIIYLGYAAGVGKTYTMLTDGLQVRAEGMDIIAGYVETHNRPETDTLAMRFEIIPTRAVHYQGLILREPDVDKITQRKPDIVLIDELAHTNAPGSRHVYRYQDIEDILYAGISVWTTLNVQHIESLNEKIRSVTKITINETVPDTFISKADEIRVVDISPEGLIKRLMEGKVYVSDLAVQALNLFFSKENLLALRQFALRFAAEDSDAKMLQLVRTKGTSDTWPSSERILVPIRPGPNAEKLVREGYRLSFLRNAEWRVISVIEEGDIELSVQDETGLNSALETAKRLGAKIQLYRGDNVSTDIVNYAKKNQITTILMGKPKGINILHSPVYKIIRDAKGIDIILHDPKGDVVPTLLRNQIGFKIREEYIAGSILVGCITSVNYLLTGVISTDNQLIIQLIPVVVTSLFFRRDVALVVAGLSIILFDFAFVDPFYTFAITDWQYFISFIGYVIIALVISTLASRLRHIGPQIWQSETRVETVGNLSQILTNISDIDEIYATIIEQFRRIGPGTYAIMTHTRSGMTIKANNGVEILSEKEMAIAWWVFEHGQPAGRSTDTLPGGEGYYLPIKGNRRVFGVIGFWFDNPEVMLTADMKNMYESIASLCALALERVQ